MSWALSNDWRSARGLSTCWFVRLCGSQGIGRRIFLPPYSVPGGNRPLQCNGRQNGGLRRTIISRRRSKRKRNTTHQLPPAPELGPARPPEGAGLGLGSLQREGSEKARKQCCSEARSDGEVRQSHQTRFYALCPLI